MIFMGVTGSSSQVMHQKKTTNYKFTIRATSILSIILVCIISLALNLNALILVIMILGGILGFNAAPIMPISMIWDVS